MEPTEKKTNWLEKDTVSQVSRLEWCNDKKSLESHVHSHLLVGRLWASDLIFMRLYKIEIIIPCGLVGEALSLSFLIY